MRQAIIMLVVLSCAAVSHAAVVTFTLSLDDNQGVPQSGAWTVYTDISGSPYGIASEYVDLVGINVITAAANLAPTCTYRNSTAVLPDLPAGFSFLRTELHYDAGPSHGLPALWQIGASPRHHRLFQRSFIGGVHSRYRNNGTKFSQYQPSGYDKITGAIQPSWSSHLAVATGTYASGATPAFWTGGANLFADGSTYHTVAATVHFVATPEPAAATAVSVAMSGLAGRRRHRLDRQQD